MKRITILRLATGGALAAVAALAWTQAPQAPEATPAPAAVDPYKHKCGEIPEFPRKLAPESQKRAFERALRDYGTCIRLYVEERNAAMNAQRKTVQTYVDEYNKALAAYQAEKDAAAAK